MTTLEKFNELKDSAYKKYEGYIKEGKPLQQAIRLVQEDIDSMVGVKKILKLCKNIWKYKNKPLPLHRVFHKYREFITF